MGSRKTLNRSVQTGAMICLACLVAGLVIGCGDMGPKGWLDPTAVGRWKQEPLPVSILTQLDSRFDAPELAYREATDVRPADLEVHAEDYVIGPNDSIAITVADLVNQGVDTFRSVRVSESGYVLLPLIGQVKAAGLTEAQLQQAIVKAYRDADLITNANVSVTVTEARARTFSITGAVVAPNIYTIIDPNFRILDALVMAHDVTTPAGIDYIYVIRQDSGQPATQPAQSGAVSSPAPASGPSPDLLAPRTQASPPAQARPVMFADQMEPATEAATATMPAITSTEPVEPPGTVASEPAPAESPAESPAPAVVSSEPEAAATTAATPAAATTAPSEQFEFQEPPAASGQRVIRIPYEALHNGDLRYNIVVRPKDMIIVQPPTFGEYFVGGHVMRPGTYVLTGRKLTLTQAIISAGMFDPLAIPGRTDLIRRVGPDKQVFFKVNLDAIFAGAQPDVYLRPYDQINVGTSMFAPFLASLRGAFRATYGFGFLYDRNFAYDQRVIGP